MPSANRILIVDRSPGSSDEVATHLRLEGHEVLVIRRAAAALASIRRELPLLAIVDTALPDISGTELLRTLGEDGHGPVLPVIMTSDRDDELDRLVAFELGADDYLVRPFSLRELALRVRAIVRRTGQRGGRGRPEVIRVGPLAIDVPRHCATVDARTVDLTPLEFRLLRHLAERAGRVQTRDTLLEEVWLQSSDSVTRAVDTSIKRLRRKLGRGADWIETVRGVGYRVRDPRSDGPR